MFSIIIPLYNKADYIFKAVNSVFNQTFLKFELIVVNDGSTDKSLDKIEQITDERINIINQENAGVSIARNNGVKQAKYNYVAFLDADDWWDEHFLEEMKLVIEKYTEAGIYGCNYYYVKNGKYRFEDKGLEKDFTSGYIDYFKLYSKTFCLTFNSSSVVVDKTVFHNVGGFNQQLTFAEDFDLWVRIGLKHKIAYLNKPLSYYNQDVEIHNRALGFEKLWEKDEHVIFNLDYLAEEESTRPELKCLLDGLRVRSLAQYYLKNKYQEEVVSILNKVDFSDQPFLYRFIYTYPKFLVRLYFVGKKYGSIIKQSIIKTIIKS